MQKMNNERTIEDDPENDINIATTSLLFDNLTLRHCFTDDDDDDDMDNIPLITKQIQPPAVIFYQKAASNGDMEAMYELGLLYETGIGKDPFDMFTTVTADVDLSKAFFWYEKAALLGHIPAMYNLSLLYDDDDDEDDSSSSNSSTISLSTTTATATATTASTTRNVHHVEKAIYWYEQVINSSNNKTTTNQHQQHQDILLQAMNNLGFIYHKGKGNALPIDREKALYWYEQATTLGYDVSMFNLGLLYEKQYNDLNKAIYWYEQTAHSSMNRDILPDAMKKLARLYHYNQTVKNLHKAVYWYREVATKYNDIESMYTVGLMSYYGSWERDTNTQQQQQQQPLLLQNCFSTTQPYYHYWRRSYDKYDFIDTPAIVDDEYLQFMDYLGLLYYKNNINHTSSTTTSTSTSTTTNTSTSSTSSSTVASTSTSISTSTSSSSNSTNHQHIPIDTEKAIHWFIEVINHDSKYIKAMHFLGLIYHYGGRETPMNPEKAIYWYTKAIESGNSLQSMYYLGLLYHIQLKINKLAIYWYEKAIANGDKESLYNLGLLYYHYYLNNNNNNHHHHHGNKTKKKTNDNNNDDDDESKDLEISMSGEKAIYWFTKATEYGFTTEVYNKLGLLHQNTWQRSTITVNIEKAIYWYEKACSIGDIEAMQNLALLYHYGIIIMNNDQDNVTTTVIDLQKAVYWYERTIETGLSNRDIFNTMNEHKKQILGNSIAGSYYRLGLINLDNHVSKQIQYFIKAAELGYSEAWIKLKTDFLYHQELHTLWTIEKISILHSIASLSLSKFPNHPLLQYDHRCSFCQKRLRMAKTGNEIKVSSGHINEESIVRIDNDCRVNRGGQGEVILASIKNDENEQKFVALKRYKTNYDDGRAIGKELAFLQLMQGCPYIVQCYGHTLIDDEVYIVMEGAKYGDLSKLRSHDVIDDLFETHHPLSLALTIRWMYEIACGLRHMHQFFALHRDIKPKNVVVLEDFHVKIVDLGCTNKSNTINSRDNSIDTFSKDEVNQLKALFMYDTNTLQSPNGVTFSISRRCQHDSSTATDWFGTPGYLAPEIVWSIEATASPESDIFSLGVTMVEVVIGKLTSTPLGDLIRWVSACEVPESNVLLDIITRCLDSSKQVRPSIGCLIQELEELKLALPINETELNELTQRMV